ncbi:MAG TPA: FGGY family carbohydrate kinase [Chitinophagaceae bacterium]|nr:FGGY family carbohydrate kinase [Chitinophagaceae bacterium]
MGRYVLGFDIGSSSVKAALLDIETGTPAAIAFSPASEMSISAPAPGFAEQDPDMWWAELINAVALLKKQVNWFPVDVMAIGISYQMHGLVCVDRNMKPLRPSIIWCDSRAVPFGNAAAADMGEEFVLKHYLNSPGNFTASKLKWVKENQPEIYQQIYKIMLPGDYIAAKLTGDIVTTVSGLSEGILWDFSSADIANDLLKYYDIDSSLLADTVPTFGLQGRLRENEAALLGVQAGIPVSYRAGDQPNNAWSLNVLEPGDVAATAGTSGVVYGVTEKINYDPKSRVNSFAHVNHMDPAVRLGVLLCVNGTGILNSWLRKNFFSGMGYEEMNVKAAEVSPGADGVMFYPFGNGAERVLENKEPGGAMRGLSFNRHHAGHVIRAAQEGIVFALQYGMEVMKEMGMEISTVRAGYANMFLSKVFATAFANTSGAKLELYNTDGAVGAARGAALGAGIFRNRDECFRGMTRVCEYVPTSELKDTYGEAYSKWKQHLEK